MKLLIVRHAVALDRKEFVGDDGLRPATSEGLSKMRKNVDGLAKITERPTIIVTSPLVRAVQTAEVLRAKWGGRKVLESDALKPSSKPAEFLKWLRAHVDEDQSMIALVGHEPHLSELCGWLLISQPVTFLKLKKGGACLISFEANVAKGQGLLEWSATPSMLRKLR